MDPNDLPFNRKLKLAKALQPGDRIDLMGYVCTVDSLMENVYGEIIISIDFNPDLKIKRSSIVVPTDLVVPYFTQ